MCASQITTPVTIINCHCMQMEKLFYKKKQKKNPQMRGLQGFLYSSGSKIVCDEGALRAFSARLWTECLNAPGKGHSEWWKIELLRISVFLIAPKLIFGTSDHNWRWLPWKNDAGHHGCCMTLLVLPPQMLMYIFAEGSFGGGGLWGGDE